MNVIDSSGWLEYFSNGPNSDFFATPIQNGASLLIPTISLFEVYKRLFAQRGTEAARIAILAMMRGKIVVLDPFLAIESARYSRVHDLAMADSIIYATAQVHHCELWTQDDDFKNLAGVRYIPKHSK